MMSKHLFSQLTISRCLLCCLPVFALETAQAQERQSTPAIPSSGTANITTPHKPDIEEIERISISFFGQNSTWLQSSAAIEYRDLTELKSPLDIATLLNGLSGLQADQRANFAQDSRISIRGFGTRSSFGVRGIEMTLDGVPLSTPDGQVQPSSLMHQQLAEVEVLKGPFAALYGNASGGVVAFRSREALTEGWKFEQTLAARTQQSMVMLGSEIGEFALAQGQYEGYRPRNNAEKKQASWRKSFELSPALHWDLRYDWLYDPLLEDPLALTEVEWRTDPSQTNSAAERFDTQKTTAQQGFTSLLRFDELDYSWLFATWQQQRQIRQNLAFTGEAITSSGGIVNLSRKVQGLRGNWQQLTDFGQWQLSANHEKSTDQRLGFVNNFGSVGALRRDETGYVTSTDVGADLQYSAIPNLDLYSGFRLNQQKFVVNDWFISGSNPDDSGQRKANHLNWASGANYQLNAQQSLHLSLGEGYESPTLAEMAYTKDAKGLNLDLKAAKAKQLQLGWKFKTKAIELSTDVFHINTDNELLIDQSIGGRTSYRNAAATQRIGAELAINWQQSLTVRHRFSMTQINATFDTPQDLAVNGRMLPGLAKQQLNWQFSWLPQHNENWQLTSHLYYKSQMATDDRNSQFAPSHTLWNLQSIWQGELWDGHWQAWLKGENLTDVAYVGAVVVNQSNGRNFEPGMPRQLLIGFNFSYGLHD